MVEDDDAVRRMTRQFLTIAGYTVVEARSAPEAMDLLQADSEPIDLVLTDVVMPGMRRGHRELPVSGNSASIRSGMRLLYMSAYTEDAAVDLGFLGPGSAFIEKPFSPDELARKVREVLGAKVV